MLAASRIALRSAALPRAASRAFSSDTDVLLTSVDAATGVAQLTINRPRAFNALNTEVILALRSTIKELDEDPTVRAYVLTGSEKAFAAGADIKEMLGMDYHEVGVRLSIILYRVATAAAAAAAAAHAPACLPPCP